MSFLKKFTFILLYMSLWLTASFGFSKAPTAVDGKLDLTHWDFSKDGELTLEGEWKIHQGGFLTTLAEIRNVTATQFIPKYDRQVKGKRYIGPVTYAITLTGLNKDDNIGIALNGFYPSNYRIAIIYQGLTEGCACGAAPTISGAFVQGPSLAALQET